MTPLSEEFQEAFYDQEGRSMPPQQNDDGTAKLPRVSVDFTLPLWGLIGAAIFAGGGIIAMYYQLSAVSEKVTNLQIDVKASNASTTQFTQELAFIKYRVEKLESHTPR